MSDTSLSDTLRSLAAKFDSIQEILGGPSSFASSSWPYNSLNTTVPFQVTRDAAVLQKLDSLTQQVDELRRAMNLLRTQSAPASILPLNPMYGIEVIPKREVVIPEATPLSMADRLLLNRDAKKALEAEEMGAYREDEYPLGEEEDDDAEVTVTTKPMTREVYSTKGDNSMDVEEVEKAQEIEEIEEVEEEAEEGDEEEDVEVDEEAEEEVEEEVEAGPEDDDAEELTEFEYKGNTFYRDSENNVFMLGEDGELDAENPVGTWNAEKGKIVVKK